MKYLAILLSLFLWSCQSMNQKAYHQTINGPGDILTGNYDELSDYFSSQGDTTYVVNFWATWCKPCIEELPYFEQLYTQFEEKPVEIILVSLDFPNQIESKLFPFIQKHQLKSTVIHLNDPDANRWIDLVDPSWGGAIPATLVYRKEQRTFYEKSFESYADLETILDPFL